MIAHSSLFLEKIPIKFQSIPSPLMLGHRFNAEIPTSYCENIVTSSELISQVIDVSESLPFIWAAINSSISSAQVWSIRCVFNSFLEHLPKGSASIDFRLL
jgi:hypothetical protein